MYYVFICSMYVLNISVLSVVYMCFTLMPSKRHLLWKPYSRHETSNENKNLKHRLDLDNQVESIHNLYF